MLVKKEKKNGKNDEELYNCLIVQLTELGMKENKRRRTASSAALSASVRLEPSIEEQWKDYIVAAHTATFTPLSDVFMSRVTHPSLYTTTQARFQSKFQVFKIKIAEIQRK